MPDKLQKFVNKLSPKDRELLKLLVLRIKLDDTSGLDIKRLQGHADLFRLRKGRLRVVYRKSIDEFRVVHMAMRDDQTYRDF